MLGTQKQEGRLGPLGLEQILALLVRADLLEERVALDLRERAAFQRRRLTRERDSAGRSDVPITWAEVVASFNQPARGKGRITEARIQQAVAVAAGVPFVSIDPLKVEPKLVTDTVSFAYARRNRVLPLAVNDGRMTLAVDDPYSRDVIVTMANRAGMPLDVVVGVASDIQQVLDEVFRFRASVRGAVAELGDTGTDFGNLEQLVRISAGASVDGDDRHVVHAVDFLLRYALDQRASDLHIEPKRDASHVRL